jgi:hypothetical protein
MKRRDFINSAALGVSAACLGGCKTVQESGVEHEHSGNSTRNDLALRPPLGWNSFDSYGVYLHHDAAIKNLDAMAEKLQPHGYEYFVIDGGWYGEFRLKPGTIYSVEKHAEDLHLDEYGVYQPGTTYFEHGFRPIVDHAHDLGLKIGVHIMRGIPRKAVRLNLPVKNTSYTARDIADTSSICRWNPQNYGVDMDKPGAQAYYDSVFSQVAEWGFDFVKVDDLTAYPEEILAIAEAIENSGREMVYSLSPGGPVYKPYLPYYKSAHMLRITTDIWDRRSDLDKAFDAWKQYQGIAREGFWPDLDMIPFGRLQLMSPEGLTSGDRDVALSGLGHTRESNLTSAQMRTFITIRSLAASPLFMGGDLPTLDAYSLALITNREMLACNQNGECGINVYEKEGIEVWITHQKGRPGAGWIGIFNRNAGPKQVGLSRVELGLVEIGADYTPAGLEGPVKLTDVWNNTSDRMTSSTYSADIKADDVVFLKYEI